MIKLEALRVFVTVAEIGNIRDAADRLGRTPSAVSMTLKQIEDLIGAPLFEGDRKNVLTALGRFTRDAARAQIQGYDKLVAKIHAYAHHRIGTLTLACVPSVAARLVPPLLQRFMAENPGVQLELSDADSARVAGLVESGVADLGIAGRPQVAGVVHFRPLFRDRFKVICGRESPLASLNRPLTWADLAGEALIRNGASESIEVAAYRVLAEQASLMVRNVTSLVAMAESGLGITLLPALSTIGLPASVLSFELQDSVFRSVGILERKEGTRSPVSAAFLDLLSSRSQSLFQDFQLEAC